MIQRFLTINQCCLSLHNPLVMRALLAYVLAMLASLPSISHAWIVTARELVDVQFLADDSLIILVSAPNAVEPGIYRWQRDAAAPTLLCRISSPTAFSFDRKTIVERVAGKTPELRLYAPSNCRMIDRIEIEGEVLDADVRGKSVAVALRLPDQPNELRLYGKPAKHLQHDRVLARAVIGGNVEMGFSPDGRSLVNFDLSDGGAHAWRVPFLAATTLPAWMTAGDGETTFVPGSAFVKRYAHDTLSVARWPDGALVYTMKASRSVRLRQLSVTGRYGVLRGHDDSAESLQWADFAAQKYTRLAAGSIDHAAINAAGSRVAWVLRSSEKTDQVSIEFAQINADGSVMARTGSSQARQ